MKRQVDFDIIHGMGKFFAMLLLVCGCAGCFTSRPPEVRDWSVEFRKTAKSAAKSKFGVVRVSQVCVRAPYDAHSIQVMRADGSLAQDPYNRFAAAPSQLLKGPVVDALGASGVFDEVVGPASSAAVSVIAEVTVSRLALDCKKDGSRRADVALSVLVLNHDRSIATHVLGDGAADAADGDYAKAFSEAFSAAIESASRQL